MHGRNDEDRERRREGRERHGRRWRGNGGESFQGPRNWRDEWGRPDESWRGGERDESRGRESSGAEWRERFGGPDWEQPVYAGRDPHHYGSDEQEAAWGPRAGRTGRGWSGQEREDRQRSAGPGWSPEHREPGQGSWGGLGSERESSPEYDYGQRRGYGQGSPYAQQSYGQPGGAEHEQWWRSGGSTREPQRHDPRQGFGREREGQGWGAYGSTYGSGAEARGRGGFAGRGPKSYQRSDERILEDVCQTLERHPEIDASEIEVSCERGEIVLRGSVDDRHARRMAEQCIEDLPGVKDVRNELRVQTRASAQQSATESASQGVRGGERSTSSKS